MPTNKISDVTEQLKEAGTAIEEIGAAGTQIAVIVVSMKSNAGDIQKLLRSVDFESVNFEGMTGTVKELINENSRKLQKFNEDLRQEQTKAKKLAKDFVKLQILHDHYTNLLNREQTASDCPATERVVIFEGWVKKKDYRKLEQIVSGFEAAQVSQIEPAEGEEIPECRSISISTPLHFWRRSSRSFSECVSQTPDTGF